ncbi:hypothetical protein ElyMa_001746000 [Elysia marginata]|uniref:Uncharacterized protein n=1 Tax=Elysia marginata TaxID=1093978 RepID=A0AAV4EAK5_9GAST|nr:hypothetical protein ElyMa_001746000 [Elysia marginata]
MARRHCEDDGKYVDQRSEKQRRVETWCGGPYPAVDGRSLKIKIKSRRMASHRDGETDTRAGGDKAQQKRAPPPSCFVVYLWSVSTRGFSLFSNSSASNIGVEPGSGG